jgi:hypothetical protein
MLVLGVPIIDAFWIIVRRLAQRRSPFSPDRGHIHHRLLDIGMSHRQTVLLIYAICVGLAVLALFPGARQLYAFLGVFAVSGFVLFFLARGYEPDTAVMPPAPQPGVPVMSSRTIRPPTSQPPTARQPAAQPAAPQGTQPALAAPRALVPDRSPVEVDARPKSEA